MVFHNAEDDRIPETDWETYWRCRCSELERRNEELWDELATAYVERDAARRQRSDLLAEVHQLKLGSSVMGRAEVRRFDAP